MMGLTPQKTITTILTKECNKKLSAYLLAGVTKSCTELYKHSAHSATVMFHGGHWATARIVLSACRAALAAASMRVVPFAWRVAFAAARGTRDHATPASVSTS